MLEPVLPALGMLPVVAEGLLAAEPSLIVPPADGPAPGDPGPPLDAPPCAKDIVPMARMNAEARVIDLIDNGFPPIN